MARMAKALLNQLERQFSLDHAQPWFKDLKQQLTKKMRRPFGR
jgi:hypothetical protein